MGSSCEDFIWVKLDKTVFDLDDDIFLCTIYMSPQASSIFNWKDINLYQLLEKDITKYTKFGSIILTGDFNARIRSELDVIIYNNTYFQSSGENISFKIRNAQDSVVKKHYGDLLLDLCISSNIVILNGRCLGDSTGKFTCHQIRGSSTVDYSIVSHNLFNKVRLFYVHPLNLTFSDHCQISFILETNAGSNDFLLNNDVYSTNYTKQKNYKKTNFSYIWNEDSKYNFINALNSKDILLLIEKFKKENFNNSKQSVDVACNMLSNIFLQAAGKSLRKRINKEKTKNKNKNQKWYTRDLGGLKNEVYKLSIKLSKDPHNKQLRSECYNLKKKYKKIVKQKRREFKNEILNKLKEISNSNPTKYWKLINDLKETKNNNLHENIDKNKIFQHFKNLNSSPSNSENDISTIKNMKEITNILSKSTELDDHISQLEIQNSISTLKNGKSPGIDKITNEMIKAGRNVIIEQIQTLFNLILKSGKFPSCWNTGIITPIYKKGDKMDPSNYRGITLLNTMSKLFTSVLKQRLTKYIDKNKLLVREQIGFIPKFSTCDHIFVLNQLLTKYLSKGKRIFACFIDLKKAFDSIWHDGLLYKLAKNGITGKFFDIIKAIYSSSLGCVKIKHELSKQFPICRGIRQGDGLSPILFNLYINDLKENIEVSNNDPPTPLSSHLSCLLYADDLLVLSKSNTGLQNALNSIESDCKNWKLDINTTKSKVIIFNKSGKCLNKYKFKINNNELEIVSSYTHLGIKLNTTGKLNKAQEDLKTRAMKAVFKLKQDLFCETNIPIKIYIKTFDTIIKPILLYCSEVWSSDAVRQTTNFINF